MIRKALGFFLIMALLALLTSCATDLYLKFDAQELQNFVEVKAEADVARSSCSRDPVYAAEMALFMMPKKAAIAESYVMARGTPEIRSAAKIISELVEELRNAYATGTPSKAYCEIKYGNISAAAARIAATISRKE